MGNTWGIVVYTPEYQNVRKGNNNRIEQMKKKKFTH